MDKDQQQQLITIIAEHTNRNISDINDHDRFNEDYGLDSIDAVGLLYAINTKYRIKISQEQAATINTVADMKNCISQQLKTRH